MTRGYRYLPGGRAYSAGVAAEPGFEIVHARFQRMPELAAGFGAIEGYLDRIGRSREALCAMDLRSPRPMSLAEFREFNEEYRAVLEGWGLLDEGWNPVARTNVAPVTRAPDSAVVHGFSYVIPAVDPPPTFVVSGGGEREESRGSAIVRQGETTADALAEKIHFVRGLMKRRLEALGVEWEQSTSTNVYTAHPPAAAELLGEHPLTWHYARPPLTEIEFEMDVRAYRVELTA